MKIDVYTSVKNASKHLSVPSGIDPSTLSLPPTFDPDLATVVPFKAQLDTENPASRTALDAQDVEAQIAAKGYAVHNSSVVIKVFAPET